MATERHEHQAWAEKEIASLIELGINVLDATRQVNFVLDNLPDGEDPSMYIFPAYALHEDPATKVDDAAAAWMVSPTVENRFKRILQARSED